MAGEGFWHTTTTTTVDVDDGLTTSVLASDVSAWSAIRGGAKGVYDSTANKTWLTWMNLDAAVMVSSYDHATDTVATAVKVIDHVLDPPDNHCVPTIALDNDGRVHVILAGHNNAHSHAKMTNPRDLSAWTSQTFSGGGSYIYMVVDPATGDIYVTDRAGTAHGSSFPAHEYGSLRISTDQTNFVRQEMVDLTGHPTTNPDFYQGDLLWADGKLHMSWRITYGSTHGETIGKGYYAYFDPTAGTWHAADGTDLGAVITWAEHASCLAIDTEDIGSPTMCIRSDGTPVLAASVRGDSQFEITMWNGATWDSHLIDGTAWPGVSGGVPMALLTETGAGGLEIIAPDVTTNDLVVHRYDDDADTWTKGETLLDTAEFLQVCAIHGDGPLIGMAHTFVDLGTPDYDDAVVLYAVERTTATPVAEHDHDADIAAAIATHDADADAHPDLQLDLPNETVFAPAYTVTDGTTLDLDATFAWGIDGDGDPYYNAAGVTVGDEAVLVLDNSTGTFSLRPVEV